MHIGSLNIPGKVILAPMCEVTKLPFRLVCKKYGAAIVYTEMIHADAYLMGAKKTFKRARILEEERPVGIQIVGSSLEKLKEAAKKIESDLKPDLIDINIGCPAYNVIKTGSGSALLKDIPRLGNIVKEISGSLVIPLTCKIRLLEDEKDTIDAAKTIEKNGAKALTIHGRTAKQGYSGKADWEMISLVKKALNIPVILNGDIVDEDSAKSALENSGCDAVMVGRAAIKSPFIIRQIDYFLKTGKKLDYSFSDRIKDFYEIVSLYEKYDCMDLTALKMLAQNITKGVEGGNELRKKISESKNLTEIKKIF